MAFEGGPLATVGITPSFITQLATQTASSGVQQALGQVWQGSGQSFFGSAGQALGGALAGSAVNIALNSALGTNVVGPQGLSLTSGANLLASTVTPYVTGAVAAGINQSINNSLKSAGPFGPILSNLGTSLVNQAFGGITNAIFGAATPGNPDAPNYIMFPGADEDDPYMSNRDSRYTLEDIVFSLKPANQGPQSEGDAQAVNTPPTATTVAANQVAGAGNLPSGPGSSATDPMAPVASQVRAKAMGDGQAPLREEPLWGTTSDGQAPLRPDGPLWPGDGDSQAPLRPDGPLWGSGQPQGAPEGSYTQTFSPEAAQQFPGSGQGRYLRLITQQGLDPNNIRGVVETGPLGGSQTTVGFIDRYGKFNPWRSPANRPTPPQTGTPLF